MQQDERPLYTLTVEEFIELSKTIAYENSYLLKPSEPAVKVQSDIIFIDDVMEITGYKKSTIRSMKCRKEIPALSEFGKALFSRKEILQWLRDGKPTEAEMIAKEFSNLKNKKR